MFCALTLRLEQNPKEGYALTFDFRGSGWILGKILLCKSSDALALDAQAGNGVSIPRGAQGTWSVGTVGWVGVGFVDLRGLPQPQ